MQPINTHYLSLQIYFDFLEDNNHDTQELRSLSSTKYWHHEYGYSIANDVGTASCVGNGEVGVYTGLIEVGIFIGIGVAYTNDSVDNSVGGNVGFSYFNEIGGTSYNPN